VTLRSNRALLLAAAGGFVLLGLLYVAGGRTGLLLGVGLAGLAATAYLALYVRPSIPITIGLMLTVFSGEWGGLGLGGLPIKPDRLMIVAGLGALLLRAPSARDRADIRLGPVHALLLLAATYALISALVSGTLTTTPGLFGLLDKFGFIPYLVFLFAPVAFATERDRNVLLVGLTVLGAYLGLTALFETINVPALVIPHYINDITVGIHSDRARGPFVEAVANGLAIFGCGCGAVVAFSRWKGGPRLFAGAVVLLCAMGVLFTVTRAIWIGSIVGTLIVLISFPEVRRWLVPVATGTGIVIVGLLLFVPALAVNADKRAKDERPVWDRKNTNAAAIRMVQHRPLLGYGWDTFVVKSQPYFRQSPDYPLTGTDKGVHNVALSNAVELGLVGTTLWLVALLAAVGGAVVSRGPPEMRAWRMCVTAFAVQWFIVAMLGPLAYAMPNLLLWTFAGVALAGSRQLSPVVAPGAPRRPVLTV
jgi:O-antigen ligase